MYIKIIIISLLVLLFQHCVKIYFLMGFNKHIFNHYPGPCHQVEGMGFGSEDMHMLPNGMTFITSGFRQSENPRHFEKFYAQNNIKGRIYLFNMKNPRKVVQEMTLTSTEDFDKDKLQPHGISAWEDKTSGTVYLFVVNHERDGQEKIEKFQVLFDKLALQHVKSYYGDPTLKQVNDIVATSEDSFFYTNYLTTSSYIGRILETLALMPWADVGYFDGTAYRIVADGIMMANGIHMSRDGRFVYVVASLGHELRIYERRNDNSLHLREIYPLHSAPDNIIVDPVTGDLYIGLHPIGYQCMAHLDDPSVRAPSQVLQIKLKDGSVSSVTELFVDDGNLISASTVATVYNKKMLIGSFLDKLVYCDVDVPL
ncbi:serum paraoxonase/arylesterase 2-like isoform X1 [Haliotis rufescens]|uniref:serum paraoxonase/arylesterase 2-like isoform X1 n=2 Tax=Haliotis rufescens TaxID=6454 RepID=UPI001EB0332A|nr:serum paraoxonase/arylesterase 2-like isoform X1 [Haliotis rufescens]XP_046377591.1 serum paraoxonase/arylesterase 2-like isoform X1 [Haliotis rufescens]